MTNPSLPCFARSTTILAEVMRVLRSAEASDRRPGTFDGLMPRQTPEPDQTMAASVLVKSNASGDFGRLLSTSAMSPVRHS
jgi:hypothetical protein